MNKQGVEGGNSETSGRVELKPPKEAETEGDPAKLAEMERLVDRLEFENAQVVEVVAVMNAATRLAEELRSALTDVLGPEVLGSQSDVVWRRLFGEDGMAVIERARAQMARPAPGGAG